MEMQASTSGADVAALGLKSVLVGSLPAALMTDDEPDRYTVEAVFTRQPDQDEVAEILGPGTRSVLANAGYPGVAVGVSDRRLEITNTSLAELRDGLAEVIADRLAEISASVSAKRSAAAAEFQQAADIEQARAATVAVLASSVTFQTSTGAAKPGSVSSRAAGAASDRAQIDDWTDEGGQGPEVRS